MTTKEQLKLKKQFIKYQTEIFSILDQAARLKIDSITAKKSLAKIGNKLIDLDKKLERNHLK